MTCGGCSGAVSRALSKVEGTHPSCDGGETGVDCTCCAGITYDVSLEKQTVVVKGDVPYEDVLEKIKKTGKEVSRVVGRFMMRSELGVRYCLAR